MDTPLLTAELDQCEARIERAERDGYLVRGRELGVICDRQLYRDRYQTFEAYCDDRWELKHSHAYELIEAARFVSAIADIAVPARESHVRPMLRGLDNDDDRFTVWRDVLESVGGHPRRVKATDVENAIERFKARRDKAYVTLDEWQSLDEAQRLALLANVGIKNLNRQSNAEIEWADWSWNPVTGCLHTCPYCYARDIAFSIYPTDVGFTPTLWPDRLAAPINRKPEKTGTAAQNIFVCSMADLFGRWVPAEWIEAVLRTVETSPQWNFLFLTKFPRRMAEFAIPRNAWLGTTVDLQARVDNAERAFARLDGTVRWLSLEPMAEPLKFSRLDLFDWVVIGGASSSKATDGSPATPEWNVPIDWIADIHQQARAAGCAVYYKTNSGVTGLSRLREYPGIERVSPRSPPVFDYLRATPPGERIG